MDPEVVVRVLGDRMISAVDRIVATCDGIDEDAINWKPPAGDTNSIYAIASHTMGSVRQSVLSILGGAADNRDRAAEFAATASSADDLRRQWAELKVQVQAVLDRIGPAELERHYDHPSRGTVTGLEMLANSATHAFEHAGQAVLTRDLAAAR